MNDFNQEIAFYAFRYALGRRTYVVRTVANYIINHKDDFDENHQKLIIKEIKEAIEKGHAGMEMDIRDWIRVLEVFEG